MKRRPRVPLLITRCDRCKRRRVCAPMPCRLWICRLCLIAFRAGEWTGWLEFRKQHIEAETGMPWTEPA